MTYIDYTDLAARYRIFDTTSNTYVNSDSIYYAEREIEARLAAAYNIPFSASHPTIKDLCIDMVYVRWMRTKNPKEGVILNKELQARIDRIVKGEEPLITGSGSMLPAVSGVDLPESTTEDYYPTHSMLDAENEYTMVDSSLLYDLESERK